MHHIKNQIKTIGTSDIVYILLRKSKNIVCQRVSPLKPVCAFAQTKSHANAWLFHQRGIAFKAKTVDKKNAKA
jgi:hypothetical protein